MKLTFLGAAHEVTGSCYYLEACDKKILIDFGMEQGKDQFQNADIPVDPFNIDMVFLTHAHIDHSGRLPLLYKRGFRGKVYMTEATKSLCDIMLKDSAAIQEFEAEWKNRKNRRAGRSGYFPIYDMDDVKGVLKLCKGYEYNKIINPARGIEVRMIDAGHLLGSASIEFSLEEDGKMVKVVFSGDIGNLEQPLIKDPQYIREADYVIMESTYGDREHGERPDYINDLAKIVQATFDKGGNVVIPSFAVGRTQEMLYFFREMKERGLVKGHDGFEVFVDSPLAVSATSIFSEHMQGYYDEEAWELVRKGINPIGFDDMRLSVTSDDSKAINFDTKPKVIISASGMCDAGRIKHHLKHNLWRSECTILFVGYQSNGTLGRTIVNGADKVKLFGEEIQVKAQILTLAGVSGHADVNDLIKWVANISPKPKKVFVTHGEDSVCTLFAERLKSELSLDASAPYSGTIYDLAADEFIVEAEPVWIHKEEEISTGKARGTKLFKKLLAVGQKLLNVIHTKEDKANAEIEKFTKDIEELIDKWE